MNYNIPSSIIRTKFARVPPIGVEGSIRESRDLSPHIHPTVQKPEKS